MNPTIIWLCMETPNQEISEGDENTKIPESTNTQSGA